LAKLLLQIKKLISYFTIHYSPDDKAPQLHSRQFSLFYSAQEPNITEEARGATMRYTLVRHDVWISWVPTCRLKLASVVQLRPGQGDSF